VPKPAGVDKTSLPFVFLVSRQKTRGEKANRRIVITFSTIERFSQLFAEKK